MEFVGSKNWQCVHYNQQTDLIRKQLLLNV